MSSEEESENNLEEKDSESDVKVNNDSQFKIDNLKQITNLQEKHKEELLEIQKEHQKELQNIRILQEKQLELQSKNNELCLQKCKDTSDDSSADKIAVLEEKNKNDR